MARRGRPRRKEVKVREPNGRASRSHRDQHHAVGPRLRSLWGTLNDRQTLVRVALDPRLHPEFQPGQLWVAQVITTEDLEAGGYIARVYGRYERVEGLGRFARSPDYEIRYQCHGLGG